MLYITLEVNAVFLAILVQRIGHIYLGNLCYFLMCVMAYKTFIEVLDLCFVYMVRVRDSVLVLCVLLCSEPCS